MFEFICKVFVNTGVQKDDINQKTISNSGLEFQAKLCLCK